MKRTLTKNQYDFLKREFQYLEENKKLDDGQAEQLIGAYTVLPHAKSVKTLNPMRVLLFIGALLIGLSMLSFVASNWSAMNDLVKFLLLLFLLISFYLIGYRYEEKNLSLSRTFYYIGAFAFGAEIFYIGQLFHLGGDWETAFFMWGIGILPLGFYLKDEAMKLISLFFIYIFIHVKLIFIDTSFAYVMLAVFPILFLFYHYLMRHSKLLLAINFIVLYEFIHIHFLYRPVFTDDFPLWTIIALPLLFYGAHRYLNKSVPLFIVNVILTLQAIGAIFLLYTDEEQHFTYLLILYFALGIIFTYIQHPDYKKTQKWIGQALHLIFGLALTSSLAWHAFNTEYTYSISIIFAIMYAIYALFLVKQGSLFGVSVVCLLILRFYVDLSLAFMNKSIAFFIGGILLIGLAYWFEKSRKGEAARRAKK